MKTTIATVMLASGAAGERMKTSRKVPPRHPLNRLARLQQFGLAFNEMHFNNNANIATTIENFTTRMKSSFNRAQCGHYDAEQKPHGGPDPNPEVRFWSEQNRARNPANGRRRRSDDGLNAWLFEACECNVNANSDDNQCFDGLSDAQFDFYGDAILNKMVCEDDDETECYGLDDQTCEWYGDMQTEVRNGKKKKNNARLSNNPEKAVRQITTGLRKWAERYLNNCHGMRKNQLPRNRAKNLYKKWLAKYNESKQA